MSYLILIQHQVTAIGLHQTLKVSERNCLGVESDLLRLNELMLQQPKLVFCCKILAGDFKKWCQSHPEWNASIMVMVEERKDGGYKFEKMDGERYLFEMSWDARELNTLIENLFSVKGNISSFNYGL